MDNTTRTAVVYVPEAWNVSCTNNVTAFEILVSHVHNDESATTRDGGRITQPPDKCIRIDVAAHLFLRFCVGVCGGGGGRWEKRTEEKRKEGEKKLCEDGEESKKG